MYGSRYNNLTLYMRNGHGEKSTQSWKTAAKKCNLLSFFHLKAKKYKG